MPVEYGPAPLKRLNATMRHGFEQQYESQQYLQDLIDSFYFYFDDKRHKTNGNCIPQHIKDKDKDKYYQPIPDWKITKDRQKTVSAALLLCLNLGVDPPDVIKTHPCARMESWIDPLNFQDSKKAIEQIGKNLQMQYETLSLRTRYKQSLDPCVEDVKRFCNSLRRASKDDQILFHYNGHGVPQPTPSGEIWVFNRGYTQYIPVSLYDLQNWLGAPCIFVWDCNSAGNIVTNFQKFVQKRLNDDANGNHDKATPSPTESYLDCFQLASCQNYELLLIPPELPADLFTCCLTCPIEISARVFLMQSPLRYTKYKIFFKNAENESLLNDPKNSYKCNVPDITIPGKLSDRRTPLGELNWIFTAITDTIAWTTLPRPLFKKLFRHDLMIAALFRNFLLAKRLMPWYNCHPISDPELPDSIATHPLWKSWDLAIDEVLNKLVHDLNTTNTNNPDQSGNTISTNNSELQLMLQQQNQNQTNQTNQNQQNQQQNLNQNQQLTQDPRLSQKTPSLARNQTMMLNSKPGSIQTQSKFAVGNLSTMSLANHPNIIPNRKSSNALSQIAPTTPQQQQQQFTGFFEQNLTAFELWLKYVSNIRNPPEQLPIVLQVLLSQVHRIRALVLLSRFLDLGPWAVYLSLSIGIFPYVLKLLQSPAPELKPILVFIWARIMSIDYKNTQTELIKEKGYMYFINVIVPDIGLTAPSPISSSSIGGNTSPLTMLSSNNMNKSKAILDHLNPNLIQSNDTTDEQKAMAVFVLSSFVRDSQLGQRYCFSFELIAKLGYYINNSDIPLLRQWCVILCGLLYVNNPLYKSICVNGNIITILLNSLKDPVPEVRTAAILSLRRFISNNDESDTILKLQQDFEKLGQQLQNQLQQINANLHQKQIQPSQQQHLEQQQMKLEQQLNNCQVMLSQLENIDLKKLKEQEISNLVAVLALINDGSSLVRKEAIIFFSHVVKRYINFFLVVAFNELTEEMEQLNGTDPDGLKERQSVNHGSVFSTVWKALLILSSDPYLENKKLVEQVIDFILIELSSHKDLGGPFAKLEQHLLKRGNKAFVGSTRIGFNVGTKMNAQNKDTHKKDENANKKDGPELKRMVSLGNLFKTINFNDNKDSNSELMTVKKKSSFQTENTSLLGPMHGTSYIPRTPRYKEHKGPIQMPLESSFLDYCTEYFQEPQMKKPETEEVGSVAYNARIWRRNRNESIIQETQKEKMLSLYGNWSKRMITLDNKTQPKILRFAQFENHVTVADDKDTITVFDWKKNEMISRFSNDNPFGTKISDIKYINEDDQSLLMTSSSDGIVKIYKDYSSNDKIETIAAWRGLTEMLLTPRSNGLILDWQQLRGSLLATGDVKIIKIWDAHTETVEVDIPVKTSSLVTSLTSDQLAGNIFVAGFADGTLRVYDRRIDPRDSMVRRWRSNAGTTTSLQNSYITNVHLQRGGYRELVSGAANGVVELWDIRSQDAVCQFVDENTQQVGTQKKTTSSLTSLQVHEHAPIIATSSRQVKIWTTSGDLLSNFKNSQSSIGNNVANTLAATGIRSYSSNSIVSTMTFHPHRMILAVANSHDTHINVYNCVEQRNGWI